MLSVPASAEKGELHSCSCRRAKHEHSPCSRALPPAPLSIGRGGDDTAHSGSQSVSTEAVLGRVLQTELSQPSCLPLPWAPLAGNTGSRHRQLQCHMGGNMCRWQRAGSTGDWTWRSETASWRRRPFSRVVTSGLDSREWQGKGSTGRRSNRSRSRQASAGHRFAWG